MNQLIEELMQLNADVELWGIVKSMLDEYNFFRTFSVYLDSEMSDDDLLEVGWPGNQPLYHQYINEQEVDVVGG